jgi:hypothetical protein
MPGIIRKDCPKLLICLPQFTPFLVFHPPQVKIFRLPLRGIAPDEYAAKKNDTRDPDDKKFLNLYG